MSNPIDWTDRHAFEWEIAEWQVEALFTLLIRYKMSYIVHGCGVCSDTIWNAPCNADIYENETWEDYDG